MTGKKVTTLYLPSNLTGSFKFAGDSTARYRGLAFETGTWQFHGKPGDTIYKWDNSGGYDSSEDKERICVGCVWKGGASTGDAFLRMHAIDVKLRRLLVGSTGTSKGTLILDDLDEAGTTYHGPVTLQTTDNIMLQKGDMICTNATVTCDGDLVVGTTSGNAVSLLVGNGTTVEVSAGKWVRFNAGEGTITVGEGGTLKTRNITGQGGSGSVLFDGGTIQCNGTAGYGLIGATINTKVSAKGGTISTGGRTFDVLAAINAVENTAGAFTVTGGGEVTFLAMGNLAGALTVGDGTTLHWFDQDGTVSATCGFTSLALGAGATIYLNGDATGVDALPATVTTTATSESKANIVINFSAIPATGASFTLLPAASADVFNVQPMVGSLVLPNEVAVVNGNLVLTIVAEDYTWNSTGTNWGDADAWTKGGAVATWADGNNAIFNTANATATLAANASPAKIAFSADATVDGSASLTVPVVSVASGVTATISAPTADVLEKTGAGTLVLGSSRPAQTTVSEGTLKMASGATVEPANLTLGSDSSTPVTFDYAGQPFNSQLETFIAPGANVTLTNIVLSNSGSMVVNKGNAPSVLTVAKDASLTFADHYSLNTVTEATINVAGGTVKTTKDTNSWIMQTSLEGRLNINVTDGGLMEFGGEVYALTCRDAVDGSTDYLNPSLHWSVVDSTLRVLNSRSFRFGYDANNKNPACPTGVFAATNSIIDIGYGFAVGHNVVGANTAGSYTVDFENCVITSRLLKVYHDRPLNAIRLNNVRYTVRVDHAEWLYSSPEFETMGAGGTAIKPITIDAGGLVLDTDGHNGDLNSDPQGAGAITKVGAGIFRIKCNQTSSSPLVCEGGETYVYDGLSVARAVTVRNGAKFTTKGTGQVTLANLALEDGAELRVDEYRSGITPMAITTSLTLPASGTVTLTKNNNFSQGKYRILEKAGITVADVQGKLVPATTGELAHSWSVEGNTLFLTVGNPPAFAWTGFAGDGKMSTGGNWLGNVAPGAGDPADFSSANMAITVEADIDATLGAVTMGDAIVTFTGTLKATSISNTLKVTVGADSTVTIDGDLLYEGAGTKYAVYKVENGGAFIVAGRAGKAAGSSGAFYPQSSVGGGIVIGGEFVNNGASDDMEACNNKNTQKWAVGPGGMTGTRGWWCLSDAANSAYFYPYTNDFTVSAMTCLRSSFGHYELNTTGWGDNLPHTITLDAGYSDNGKLFIDGTGKVVVNHTLASYGGYNGFSGAVTVGGSATLAINAGKQLTSGTITFKSGTTLEVPSEGVTTGAIAFDSGATVTLKVAGGALADGDYMLLTSTADLPAGVASRFAVDAPTESRTYLYTLDNRSLRLAVGDEAILALPCIWTGAAGDGKMGTAGNWLYDRKPETVGAVVLIPSETAAIDNNIFGFAPSSITFGNGSGAVTISGNAITCVAAITNISTTVSHTIDAPVYFAGDIQVKQAAMAETGDLTKSHVTFAGGAYAAPGYAIENGNFAAVYSRCMFGKYYFATDANSPWTATVQGSGKRHCLGDNSTLYIPYAGRLTELYVGNGSKVDVGGMAMGEGGRVSYRNNGEMVVTNLTLTGTGDRTMCWNQGTNVWPVFKFERIETSMTGNWCYFADGSAASKGVYYIGAGGVNFSSTSASGSYCIGKDVANDAQTIRPWYSDFTFGDRGNGSACLVLTRDVTFCTDDESGTGRTITMDAIARGYGSAPTITVSGSGTLRVNKAAINTTQPPVAVTNTATLAIKPGANLTTSAMTLNSGTTLQVAESGTVALGGDLSLKAGAKLGFNYTTRDAPVLDLTSKTVTFDEGETTNVVVKISSTDGKRGRGGVYALTAGGKFAGATVTLAEGYPDWVKGISVVDGEIVIDVKSKGTYIIVK